MRFLVALMIVGCGSSSEPCPVTGSSSSTSAASSAHASSSSAGGASSSSSMASSGAGGSGTGGAREKAPIDAAVWACKFACGALYAPGFTIDQCQGTLDENTGCLTPCIDHLMAHADQACFQAAVLVEMCAANNLQPNCAWDNGNCQPELKACGACCLELPAVPWY